MRPGNPDLVQLRRHRDDRPAPEVQVELPDGTTIPMDRRDFLRVGAVAAAAAGLAGCAQPAEQILPAPVRAEEARPGQPLDYAATCFACPAGCGVLARAREGRVIKVEGNPDHPVNRGTLCARGQASVLDLYDADRARRSARVYRGKAPALQVSADTVDQEVIALLKKAKGGSKVRLLTGAMHGPGMNALVQAFLSAFPASVHVAWEPLAPAAETVAEAWYRSFGQRIVPQIHFDRADVIVSLGSEFLDTWLSPVQFARDFARRRDPDKQMSRLWAFEGRMSLTGSNADRRVRVRPSQLPDVAFALAHEIIIARKHGPLASNSELSRALDRFRIDQVAPSIGVPADTLREVAKDLIEARGNAVVVGGGPASTGPAGLALEVAINLLNASIGSIGGVVDYANPSQQAGGRQAELARLADDMRNGRVDVLVIAGSNPVFNAPPVLGFAEAMSHVPAVVAVADRLDETARLADLLCAAAHPLESWSDAEPVRNVVALSQPAMRPVGEMMSLADVLVRWGAAVQDAGSLVDADKAASKPGAAVQSGGYHFLRAYWREKIHPQVDSGRDFDTFWLDLLHSGVVKLPGAESAGEPPTFRVASLSLPAVEKPGDIELVLFAPHAVYDGRGANNGWLLEYPDPVSRITWDSWAAMSRAMMESLALKNGDLVDVTAAGYTIRLPAFEQAGQHDKVVSVPLGFGRTAAGEVGNGVGANGFLLAAATAQGTRFAGHTASLRLTNKHSELAIPQGESVIDLNERPLIPVTTLCDYKDDPGAGAEAPPKGHSIWPKHEYKDIRWGMSIDLSACIGCGACTIACQAENNIPTAGKKGVIRGREMHWMRVDRYYKLPVPRTAKTPEEAQKVEQARQKAKSREWLDEPEVLFHPVMCQQCENAPCETVCPVGATTHSSEGLNQQAYNRCVGTRYCSNNCPFKVRRFNWFDYSRERDSFLSRILEPAVTKIGQMNARWPIPLKNNPEVTVRTRGVMEKCTFCVQRIAPARQKAKDENRPVADGEVVPACAQTCPTQAIKFGNLVDPKSEVARNNASKRGLHMLNDQNVGTSVTYLSKVRNES